ncbi:TPA: 30S ribosome-binding factor RbfA [Candidatus Acetothermia bacterium]|nr:30S ribosome-binding factor RbfA [Candidatus Acetothermia bacterium]
MSEGHVHARLCEEIKRELSAIAEFEVRDPVLKEAFLTVMDVDLSVDARYAKVYIAIGTPSADKEAVMAVFRRDRGFFRTELARRLPLRYTPQLEFILDETVERAMQLERLLKDEEDEIASD